ncbi:MAG TPA: cell wall hydrolase [Rhizomicrobium sp.]|jgi:spore germination cell wall hydrolase CwlJ-like protein|nr:cell wall hydrolase [Rhizomicrobium sp.]
MKTKDALSRSDRVLVGALAIVLATASMAIGASLNANAAIRPHTDEVRVIKIEKPVVKIVQAPAIPSVIARSATTNIVVAKLLQEHKCLSEVMYYEARGEGEAGERAVAEVVFHRMNAGNYGHSICAVVYEGVGTNTCQFSFACDGSRDASHEGGPWRNAQALAARIMAGEDPLVNATGGALNFHAAAISPEWTDNGHYQKTVQIGNHVFYRRGHAHQTSGI